MQLGAGFWFWGLVASGAMTVPCSLVLAAARSRTDPLALAVAPLAPLQWLIFPDHLDGRWLPLLIDACYLAWASRCGMYLVVEALADPAQVVAAIGWRLERSAAFLARRGASLAPHLRDPVSWLALAGAVASLAYLS